MPRIIISTTNDISTDNRVHKVAIVLQELGYEVLWIGRLLPGSLPLNRPYSTKRFALTFNKGPLFYAEYNIRLFFFLLFKGVDVLLSNDLDTILANRLVSRLRNKKLVYDSHEFFLGVPELQDRPFVRWIWARIEKSILPNLAYTFTVNESIADLYLEAYGRRPKVFRNISMPPIVRQWKSRKALGLPDDAFIFINQGTGINVDRGMEEMLEALAKVEGAMLLLVGSGDVLSKLKERASNADLDNRVIFVNRMPYEELLHYTKAADVGVSLDKDNNINYKYSLPNKLFDYIYCQKPIMASRVVEVAGIVKRYQIGEVAADHKPDTLAALMKKMMKAGSSPYSEGLKKAAAELNWEKEKQILIDFYKALKLNL